MRNQSNNNHLREGVAFATIKNVYHLPYVHLSPPECSCGGVEHLSGVRGGGGLATAFDLALFADRPS